VPTTADARIDWLYRWWGQIDGWIEDQKEIL